MYAGRGRGVIYVNEHHNHGRTDGPAGGGRGRGRGLIHVDEHHNRGRTDEPGGSRQHYFHPDDVQFHCNPSRNDVNEHGFGPQIGDPRQDFYYNSHLAARPESNRMTKFMPDPRLQPKIIPHDVDQYPYSSNENPNYTMEEPICNAKGKSLRPPQSGSPVVGITRMVKPGARNNEKRHEQHLNEGRFDRQFSSMSHESSVVDENIHQNVNLDSLVHNLLDSLDDGIVYDNQSRHSNEEPEEPEDFPTRYANYQRSFDDFEKYAVALPCDPRLQKSTVTSGHPSSGHSKNDSHLTARVKPEPREKITGPQQDVNIPENNLKQALEDIRQRQQTPSTPAPYVSSYSEVNKAKNSNTTSKTTTDPQPKKITPPKPSSNKRDSKGNHQSPELSSDKTRRKVVEDSESRNSSSRSSRNSSPGADRRRTASGRMALGSPEWHRQVRMVDKPDPRNRDSREREMRRVRRLSRSRSRSRSPRRTQRYFRYGSPERRSRSRSPISRRARRVSPEYPHRRWGQLGPSRNSRSPVRTRDRRRSPPDHSHRNVVERTVIMRQRSRSLSRSRSRSPSRSSSQQQQNSKRLKDHHAVPAREIQQSQPPPSSSKPAVNVDSPVAHQTTQLFTRNYVVANQVDHVAHIVQPIQPVQQPITAARYVAPPNTVPPNVSTIPPLMNYYNHQQQHYQATVQQQIDIITYQHQQQHHHHHLQQQQFNQQQLYQQHLQQMNQNPVAHQSMPSSPLIPIIHPAGVVNSPARHNIPPPQTLPNLPSTSTQPTTAPTTNSEGGSVEEQRTRKTRDGLLEKQANLIHQLLVLQVQQADLELKQKSAEDGEYERLSNNIIETAKFGKEMMVSAQSLEKIIQKHTNQLKEDLSELKKTRSSNRYNYYDPQQHWCELCDVITDKLNDYLTHLHSKEHEERLQSTGVQSTPWHKKRTITPEEKGGIRIPFNGLQNLQPVKAWYCELCDVWMGDLLCAKLHMSSSSHNDQHMKRSMERPESLLNHATKKQAALRRNLVRKREEERVRNQQKQADKMKMDAERKEAAKKREEENEEKQRLMKEKWQDFVRNEEANKASVVELEGEPTGEKSATIQRSTSSLTSSSIRLNIRTPLMTTKTMDQDDTSEAPISSLMETSDSIEGQVILTEKEISVELSAKQVSIDGSNKEGFEQRSTLDVQTDEPSVVNPTENIIKSNEIGIEPPPCLDGVAEKAAVPDSLPMDSSDKEEPASVSREAEASKDIPESSNPKAAQLLVGEQKSSAIVLEEKDVCDRMDSSTCSKISMEKTDVKTNSNLINSFQQMVPISQNNLPSTASTVESGETKSADPMFHDRISVPEQTQQVDENSQAGVSAEVSGCNSIDGSQQNSDSNLSDSQEKRFDVQDGILLPKIEPKDSEEIGDCCVILEVNPKLSKVPELIDLESSNEECDQQAAKVEMETSENSEHCEPLSESGEEKCDSLLVGENRASTPCKIQFGEFIVLSETTEDSSGIDADSRASINSSSELSSGERLVVVEEAPGDETETNKIV
ncbi:uncharacterized protein LOC124194642 isoform X2 [Daphnia pulex]|uniref:uncharacterized protein LOC124194642 isoform X2 n=1 Tax=Daphnia pulex TaxID=6669 RepID=UPI001EDE4BD2|nr:uncharacterized protein LOC124194642 isoform X2 [Daphnia pulex]